MEFITIGVYNTSEAEFFEKMVENNIDTFCDIRRRRGVRGAKYAFVNSKRLQEKLYNLGISYFHFVDLAPTNEIRELQKATDLNVGELKRDRSKLGQVFTEAYKEIILENFDFNCFLEKLNNHGAKRVALFCVEEKPAACHRSIVAEELNELGYKTAHM